MDVLVGITGPAVFFQVSSPPELPLQQLDMEVHVVVKGPQFEKAVNLYTRKVISDSISADQHSVSTNVSSNRLGDPLL